MNDLGPNFFPDLVIKMAVNPDPGSKDPVFYRVSSSELQDDPFKTLSYQSVRLVGDVVENCDKYAISFDYKDSDGDRVLIDSETSLQVAMKEAANAENILKLTVFVTKIDKKGKKAKLAIKPIHPMIKPSVDVKGDAERRALKMTFQQKEVNAGKVCKFLEKDLHKDDSEGKTIVDADKSKNVVVINKIQPFIHGNHQCTTCGMYPIIGDRFVFDDKQLCGACSKSFGGAEQAENPADMSFQKLWRREHRAVYRPIVLENKAQSLAERAERKNKRVSERVEKRKASRVASLQEKGRPEPEVDWLEVAKDHDIVIEKE